MYLLTRPHRHRRQLLVRMFLGLGAASVPSWVKTNLAQAQQASGPELDLPFGALGAQDFGPLVQHVVEDDLGLVNHQLFAPADFQVRLVLRAGINPITKTASGTTGHVNPDGGAVYPSRACKFGMCPTSLRTPCGARI